MKTTLTAIVFFAAFSGFAQSTQAQWATIDTADYAVYFAEPKTTGWYIDWIDDDGNSIGLQGPYESVEVAQERVLWFFLGGNELTNHVEIVELPVPTQWVHYETYDTIGEAMTVATFFEGLGLQADVRRIAKFDLRLDHTFHNMQYQGFSNEMFLR